MDDYDPIRIARFWSKVDVTTACRCWTWKGSVGGNGYGKFRLPGRKSAHAHRVAWELANGQPLGDRFACHTCDNKVCVNPMHLYAGDRLTNAADAVARGRIVGRDQRGERNGNARLTEEQVSAIRTMIAEGVPNTHIAPKFGVTHSLVSRIRRGRSWTSEVRNDQQ